jgi:hypothetical protein
MRVNRLENVNLSIHGLSIIDPSTVRLVPTVAAIDQTAQFSLLAWVVVLLAAHPSPVPARIFSPRRNALPRNFLLNRKHLEPQRKALSGEDP